MNPLLLIPLLTTIGLTCFWLFYNVGIAIARRF